jgi:hypothetical protein
LAPLAALACYSKIKSVPLRLLVLFHWVQTALVLFLCVFGLLSNADWRLSPLVGSAAVTTAAFALWLLEQASLRRFAGLLLAVLLGFAALAPQSLLWEAQNPRHPLEGLAQFLTAHAYTRGYAGFWIAGAVNVLANGAVRLATVELDETEVRPRRYQTEESWFASQPGQREYVVVLDQWEYNQVAQNLGHPLHKGLEQTLSAEGYFVLVYHKNIFPQ